MGNVHEIVLVYVQHGQAFILPYKPLNGVYHPFICRTLHDPIEMQILRFLLCVWVMHNGCYAQFKFMN